MTLSFKPHVLALIGSAGLLAVSGALYVHSRAAEPPAQPVPVAQPVTPAPTTAVAPLNTPAVAPTFSSAQIDQLVAPVALYPDALLSQVLMASTYPSNVLQAVQWSQDNPNMQGDPAVQAVANQPWDPSVKSLVAFPALLSLMGENPQWVQDLGNAFLAQPQDVMNSVQKLRNIALQTGTLQSTPQQKVTTTTKVVPAATGTSTTTSATTATTTPASTQIVTIESADPNMVYVPTYNPSTAYGTWPNTTYPPVYLPPPPGEQFGDSFMRGFGFSLGVATTYAIFSDIDWDDDDDDYHHHNGDWDGGGYARNGDNIRINVNNFNRVTGEHLTGNNVRWQHNPNYRSNVPYPNNNVTQRFNQTAAAGGLSATQSTAANRTAQRQAAATQFQERTGTTVNNTAATRDAQRQAAARSTQRQPASRDAQRQAASKELHQVTQRNNYRGYDGPQAATAKKQQRQTSPAQQQQRRESAKTQIKQPSAQQQQRRQQTQTPERRQQQMQTARANALSGNDSRSPSWEAQRQRGIQSRSLSSGGQRPAARGNVSQHREMRQR